MAVGDYFVNGILVRSDGAVYTTTTANMAVLAASDGSSLVGFAQSSTPATDVTNTVAGAIARAFGLLPMNGLVFFDTFTRANTTVGNLGTSESGHAWDLRGPFVSSYPLPASNYGTITNGMFVADPASTAVYGTQTFTETVTRIGARVSWTSSGGALGSTLALIVSLDDKFIDSMMHFHVSRSSWELEVREAGGAFINLLTGTISPTLAADGMLHTFEISFSGRSATVNVNGKIDSIYDERIPNNLGKYAVWEHFYNSNPSADLLRIHAVWAGCAPMDEYQGNLLHTASTGVTTAQGDLLTSAGVLTCVGKVDVESTITAIANASATGGFRRARYRWLDHAGTGGWIAENIGDGVNNLRFQELTASAATTVVQLYKQGFAFSKIQDSITAFATGGQANAVALTGQICRVTVCATSGDSVKLPAASGTGLAILVINDGAASCGVFPATGGAVDALGTNNARAVAAGARIWFYDIASNTWSSDD